MKFIFNRLNIDFIEIRKQNVIYINDDDDNVINKYRKINNDKFETQFFKIHNKDIILNSRKLL